MTFRKSFIITAALAVMMVPSFGAARQPDVESADLVLKAPAASARYIIDGSEWACSDTSCHAAWVDDMPVVRSCQRVVSEIGAVSSFTYRGKALSADDLARCNVRAKA